MIIGVIVKYAGIGKSQPGLRFNLINNLTSAPQTLWVSVSSIGNFTYQLKGVLHTVTKSGNEIEEMVRDYM